MATKIEPAKRRRTRSVVKSPSYEMSPAGGLILSLASMADDFPAWGTDPTGLDLKLRTFWPTECYLQSALYAIATRNAAFSWTLQGGESVVEYYREMLTENWIDICYKWNIDYLTQNNGAFIEIIRETDAPDSLCIGINHLDSSRCRRTGVADYPIVYTDIEGYQHKLAPHQVWAVADMPSPIETMNGVGMCATYRILREAQRMRDISVHDREKLQGFVTKGFILVNNVSTKNVTEMLKEHNATQMQKGFVRYNKPAIFASLDPSKPATAQVVDLADMGDGFNKDLEMKWYITVLAMALGCDYQDLAPLSSGNLGTSTQSQTLHLKSKGKGPAMYMKRFAHMMNWSGILPKTVEFEFDEKDVEDDINQEELAQRKANQRQVYITTGVKSPLAVRTEMLETGEITQEIFDLMAKEDEQKRIDEEARRQDELRRFTRGGVDEDIQEDEDSPSGDIKGPTANDDTKAKGDYADTLRKRLEGVLAKDMTGALKKAFALLKERILSEAGEKAVSDVPRDDQLWNEIRMIIQGAVIPHIQQVAMEAAEYKSDLGYGVDMDLVNQHILAFTRTYKNDWWDAMEATRREGLREALVTWQESGLGKRGLDDLLKTVEDVFFDPVVADRIAVTEVTRIFDEGNRIAERSMGVQEQVWQTSRDETVCDICDALDGKHYPIDEAPFPVTDTHPNCRCARLGVGRSGQVLGD